jgi:hypothetical protein
MDQNQFKPAFLRRDQETFDALKDILGITSDAWNLVDVSLRPQEAATATVEFLLTADQYVAIAALAGPTQP